MSRIDPQQGLMPSVLDRLIDPEADLTSLRQGFDVGQMILAVHRDTSSAAAVFFHVLAWGAVLKASLLMLFPDAMASKARRLVGAGFLTVVVAACLAAGGYLTWFGYVRP